MSEIRNQLKRADGSKTTVYHRTDTHPDIIKSQGFKSKENTNEVFVSNRKNGQAKGYGKYAISLKVPKQHLRLDDEFPSGEKHYGLKVEHANKALKG